MLTLIATTVAFVPSMTRLAARTAALSMAATVGDKIPLVTFKARVRDDTLPGPNPFKWKDVTTYDLFKGKRVVLFALPGAFTPTCSSTHVPGYDAKYDEIRSYGIDDVYCLSVNDAFVMRQWGIHQKLETEEKDASNPLNPGNFKKVKFIPDGAGLFTKALGFLTLWDTNRGFGERSWRYSAVINDLVIEKIFVEGGGVVQNSEADPFEVSDADTIVNYLKTKK
eukprot:gene17409-22958_t